MSEPQKLGDILLETMMNIKRRCELNPDNQDFNPKQSDHRDRVLKATADFLSNKSSKKLAKQQKQRTKQKVLF